NMIQEFYSPGIEALQMMIVDSFGAYMFDFSLIIYVKCKSCREKI
ncbi:transcriptional repressor, partial [Francisella tularensis subsp. holarctica]|nr:transcriptional repressor [Francisella tularensis subsp. holarctica]